MANLSDQSHHDQIIQGEKNLFYVLSTSSYLDDKIQVLNHAATFAIFNPYGDFQRFGNAAYGLFHEGCRYLSVFELRINRQRPLLLSSVIKDNNEMLKVDLTNPNLEENGVIKTPKGVIHILRSKFIFDGICYERVIFDNFDLVTHEIDVTFSYDADFKDIFEVRGIERQARGEFGGFSQKTPQCLGSDYKGIDGIIRSVRLHFSIPMTSCDEHGCGFKIQLKPHSNCCLYVEIESFEDLHSTDKHDFKVIQEKLIQQFNMRRSQISRIEADNEQFNDWVERSTTDLVSLLAKTDQGLYPYAGVPWYNTIFGRDGIITALLSLWNAPHIAKDVLLFLARTQAKELDSYQDAEPGKIVHEMRSGEMANLREIPFKQYYGTVDATPLFVWLAGEYYKRTADKQTLRLIWPNIIAALKWMDEYGDADNDGYIEYHRKGDQGLYNQGWKDSFDAISHSNGSLADLPIAVCEVQGYAYAAKSHASRLAQLFGEYELGEQLATEAAVLKENFNRDFWDEDLQSFCLALDGQKKLCRVLSSNPSHCLMTGIVNEDKAAKLVQTMVSPDLFSGWGIRTLGRNCKLYNPMSYHNGSIWPHDNAMAAIGFSKYGFKLEAMMILDGLFGAACRFEQMRLPELYCGFERRPGRGPTRYPVACSPQAWAAVSLFGLVQAALCIDINAVEKYITFDRPLLPSFVEWISIDNINLGPESMSVEFTQHSHDVGVNVRTKPNDWKIIVYK